MYKTTLFATLLTSSLMHGMDNPGSTAPVPPRVGNNNRAYTALDDLRQAAAEAKKAGLAQASGTVDERNADPYRAAGATVHCPEQLTRLVLAGFPVTFSRKPPTCTFTYPAEK